MKRWLLACVCWASVLVMTSADPATAQIRVGGGIHYLRTLGDIKDVPEFDENAIGIMASATKSFPLIRVEADVEWIPDFGGSSKSLIQPQAWGMVGNQFYGSLGIGIGYFDGDFQDEPFYALRVGVNFGLFDLDFDAFASYRFQDAEVFEGFDESDLDALTFGALARFTLD